MLKKPSDYFKKDIATVNESVQELVKTPELNTFSDALESFKKNLGKIEVLSEFSDTLDNYHVNIEKVNYLSDKVEDIQTEVQSLLKKEDLDRAMMSQLLVVEQSIRDVQSKVKGINEKNLTEIRLDVSGLTESVNEFLEVEVPKYKKLVVDSELRSNNRYEELEENVNKTLEGIGEFVDNKYQELTENLQGINEESLASIIEDFKSLDKIVSELKEQEIPKYKGFIVETERKTESKLNEFQNKLDETVNSILEKVDLIEGEKTNLIGIANKRIQEIKNIRDYVIEDLKNSEEYKKQISKKVTDLEVEIVRNESHIKVQNKNLKQIQEDIRSAIQKLDLETLEEKNYELGKKVKYLEEIFEKFNEKEILTENIIVEPPSTDNKDPLTPLDQNFVTLDQLQQHYRLFINRIQQQLATIGGGGETRLEFLDDVDRNSAKQNGYVLQYDSSVGKFIGTSYVPGGGGGESYWVSTAAGIHTLSNVGIGTTNPTAALFVEGDARITGILSVGQGTVTINGITNTVNVDNLVVGTTLTGPGGVGYATVGYVTQQISNLVDGAPGALDTLNELAAALNDDENFATTVTNSLALKAPINNANLTGVTTTATLNVGVGGTIITTTDAGDVGIGSTQPTATLDVVGDVTATSFSGSGVNLTGIVTSIVAGTNITISGSTGEVTINSSGGGGESISPFLLMGA